MAGVNRSGRRATLTPLGKALRGHEAYLRSAWEHDYGAAIEAARAGVVTRLVDLLRARRPLTDDDFDLLADYVEETAKRRRGRERNDAVHDAMRLAEAIMAPEAGKKVRESLRAAAINAACCQIERERGAPVNPEHVRDLMKRPKARRRLK
jgi:hypothetical protein